MPRNMQVNGPTISRPEWTNDTIGPERLIPTGGQLDPAQFLAPDGFVVTVSGAGAAQNATSIPLASAIPAGKSIPNGTVLKFSGGNGRFAKLTAAANAGANALTVEAIPVALPAGVTAPYQGTGKIFVPAGTVVGRTITERDADAPFGPGDAADDTLTFTANDVRDAADNAMVSLLRPYAGTTIKEEKIPGGGFAGLTGGANGALATALRARFVCQRTTEPA